MLVSAIMNNHGDDKSLPEMPAECNKNAIFSMFVDPAQIVAEMKICS
jgi:hypothetical protein